MDYEPVDHAPFWNMGFWPETIERWSAEGHQPQDDDLKLGADLGLGNFKINLYYDWFHPNPPFEHKIVDENEDTILSINHEGILMREMKNNPKSSMPQFVKFPVETREEFRKFWKERMQPDLSRRVGPDWKTQLKATRSQPHPLIIWSDRWGGFFGPLRNLVGIERLCILFYKDPAFLEEMMDTDADFIIEMLTQILDVVNIDAFMYWEDMAYKTAPLISPKLARQYMLPRYKRVNDFLKHRGVPFIGLDSDGQIHPLIPVWLEAGINFLWPFEVQAGMDVLEVRKEYGKDLRIIGGFDKRALAKGPAAIDAECQRLKPLINEGGYIPCLDHVVPPDVPFKNYCYFMKKLKETCEKK